MAAMATLNYQMHLQVCKICAGRSKDCEILSSYHKSRWVVGTGPENLRQWKVPCQARLQKKIWPIRLDLLSLRPCLTWYDMRYEIWDMIYDIWYMIYDIWCDMIWYVMVWYGMIWYMLWYDICCDMIYIMICYDM